LPVRRGVSFDGTSQPPKRKIKVQVSRAAIS
jgi:hypothetical protein